MPGQANRDDRHCSKQTGIEVRCSFLLSTPLPLAMTQRLACSQNVANMNFCQHYCARQGIGQESCFRKSPQHLTKSENWFRRNLRIESVQLNFCCGRMMPGQANRDDRHCSKQSGIEVRCSFLLSTPLPLAMRQRLACSQNVANMNFCQHYCARHRTGGITTNQSVIS